MVVSNYWIKKERFRFSHKETLWKNKIYIFTSKILINRLPAQVWELQDSHVRLCPGHLPSELSLLIILVLILMRVPPPQRAEQSPLSQLLHSQFIGVSWIEYNVHNVSYNINLFLITTILNISTNSNTYGYNFRTIFCRNFWPVDFVTI